MASLFVDPKYKKMKDEDDWLNLAIQPFEFSVLEALHSLPDVVEVSNEDIESIMQPDSWTCEIIQFHINTLLGVIARGSNLERSGRSMIRSILSNQGLYELRIEGDTIDLEKGIYPKISAHRVKDFDEDEIFQHLARHVQYHVRWHHLDSLAARQLNEILDTFDCNRSETGQAIRRSTSIKKKAQFLAARVYDVINSNEWNIKNGDLILQLGDWIKGYLEEGNLRDLSNITRLKCMVHKGEPIYSMGEV